MAHHLMHGTVTLRFLPIFDQDRRELVQQGETHEQQLGSFPVLTILTFFVVKGITYLGICLHRPNQKRTNKQRLKESEMASTFAESQRSLSKWIPIWTTDIHCVRSKVQQFPRESAAWYRINVGHKEDDVPCFYDLPSFFLAWLPWRVFYG